MWIFFSILFSWICFARSGRGGWVGEINLMAFYDNEYKKLQHLGQFVGSIWDSWPCKTPGFQTDWKKRPIEIFMNAKHCVSNVRGNRTVKYYNAVRYAVCRWHDASNTMGQEHFDFYTLRLRHLTLRFKVHYSVSKLTKSVTLSVFGGSLSTLSLLLLCIVVAMVNSKH
jgi:hypothetical protein